MNAAFVRDYRAKKFLNNEPTDLDGYYSLHLTRQEALDLAYDIGYDGPLREGEIGKLYGVKLIVNDVGQDRV